jgi:ribulose-phosphate 3-epimerase
MGRMIRIAPSLLDADFGCLAEQIGAVERAGADMLHLDIMDGHFVPNLSIGVPVVAGVKRHTRLPLDVHLMITDPACYAPKFAEAGASSITFHIEAAPQPREVIGVLRKLRVQVGVSLNPGTPAEALDDILADVDMVLVMTVWPGFGGQKFIAECLEKISRIAARLRPDQALEVDGGINTDTAPRVVAAGADTLVAGKAIFSATDPAEALVRLRRAATEGGDTGLKPVPQRTG